MLFSKINGYISYQFKPLLSPEMVICLPNLTKSVDFDNEYDMT